MKIFQTVLIIILLSSTTVMAAPASENSIKQLLSITQAQKLINVMRTQIDSIMDNAIRHALKGETPNAGQKQAIIKMKKRMAALLQGELAWKKIESMYIRLYKESFTEEEIAGMIAFYKTPAGQAVLHKLPVLMKKIIPELQKMTFRMTPKIQKIEQDFVSEMKAASR